MSKIDYNGSMDKAKKEFEFLINDYQYKLTECESSNDGFILVYKKNERRVRFYYDYKENTFYFRLINGSNTKFPNDDDLLNIKLFFELFKKYDPLLDSNFFEPTKEGYEGALHRNAEYLKKYGDKVLKGIEWI